MIICGNCTFVMYLSDSYSIFTPYPYQEGGTPSIKYKLHNHLTRLSSYVVVVVVSASLKIDPD